MCMMCDGWTLEEMLEDQAARIERDGWLVIGVEARRPWLLHDRAR
jgi:hypothetical protein